MRTNELRGFRYSLAGVLLVYLALLAIIYFPPGLTIGRLHVEDDGIEILAPRSNPRHLHLLLDYV